MVRNTKKHFFGLLSQLIISLRDSEGVSLVYILTITGIEASTSLTAMTEMTDV